MESNFRRLQATLGDENAGNLMPSKQASMAASHALQQARAMEAPKINRRTALQPRPDNIPTSNSSFRNKDEDTSPGSDATIDDIADDQMTDGDEMQYGDDRLEIDSFDEAFDDAQLMSSHEHTASFADDESDLNDIVKLRLAIQSQPVETCNPHALFPSESVTSRLIYEKSAQVVQDTPGVLDFEDEDTWDAGMVLEYSDDIFRHMRVMELRLLPAKGYMAGQKEFNWSLRRALLDWLVKLHHRFNLLPETLFLCVNYIDRFLSLREVPIGQVQLVGAVALFVAAKFEEINYLSVQEVSQMVEYTYETEDILKAERYMIDLLDFNLGFPGPMSFLRRVSKADDYDLETRTLAKYLLELTIMDERFVAAPPSWTSAIAHYMSRHMLRKGEWTPKHVYFSTYTEEQLLPGVTAVRETLNNPMECHAAVFEKYSERKFRRAAVFVQNWVNFAKEHPESDFAAR